MKMPLRVRLLGDLYGFFVVDNIVMCWVYHATNNFALSGCSESLMIYHSYTVQLLSLYNSIVSGR
jgi:hypothetical protein